MKYLRLFENFEAHDPYELMMIPQNKKAEMIVGEIKKNKPNLNLVSDLIVLGANLEWQDEDNWNYTPLHKAAEYGKVEIARMLIGAKADLNVKDNDGWTPLHLAASWGYVEIARMLIDAGANLDVKDEDGLTPLHGAARWGYEEISKMLIDAGARKDIANNKGLYPYDLTSNQKLKKLLNPNISENFDSYDPYELMIISPNKKAEMIVDECKKFDPPNLNLVKDLITLGANVNWQDESNLNRTPMHIAAEYGSVEITQMLIDAGVDVNVQDEWYGCTPLHRAIDFGQAELVGILIDAKAKLDMQDRWGYTPLHYAAMYGKVKIARMLIDAGARKDIQDNEGKTPYDLANTKELKNILKP